MTKFTDLTNKEYRAAENISASDIKDILKNPYKWANGIKDNKQSTSLVLGSAIHSLILEPENFERDFIVGEIDKRTKAGKEFALKVENSGKTFLKSTDFEIARNVAQSFKSTDFYQEHFVKDFGEAETSYFMERADGIKAKCRPDYFNLTKNIIIDLKTTNTENGASPNEFLKAVSNYGYYIQAKWYLDITGAKAFYFVALETSEPYSYGVYELDHSFLDLATDEIEKALKIYKNIDKYTKQYKDSVTNDEIMLLTAPAYLFYKK